MFERSTRQLQTEQKTILIKSVFGPKAKQILPFYTKFKKAK